MESCSWGVVVSYAELDFPNSSLIAAQRKTTIINIIIIIIIIAFTDATLKQVEVIFSCL